MFSFVSLWHGSLNNFHYEKGITPFPKISQVHKTLGHQVTQVTAGSPPSSLSIRSTRSTRECQMVLHRLKLKSSQKIGIQGASAALRHFRRKAATLTSAARSSGVLPATLSDPHCGESLSSCGVDADKVVKVSLLGA